MRQTLTILAFLAIVPAGAARADDDCLVPMADWQPRDAVAAMAAEAGWDVRRIKIDDGCYEIDGRDLTGRQIEVKIHPATLHVIGFEYEDADDGDDHENDHGDDQSDDNQGDHADDDEGSQDD